MAKGGYIGVGSTAHKLKSGYVGVGGTAYEFNKGYVGVGGTAYEFSFADAESKLDELFSGMTVLASDSNNNSTSTVSLSPVANSYYLTGGSYDDGAFFAIGYYDTFQTGITTFYAFHAFSSTYKPRFAAGDYITVTLGNGAQTNFGHRGMYMARVSFTQDPAELFSHLSLCASNANNASSTAALTAKHTTATNPSYYICTAASRFIISKLKDGALTTLFRTNANGYLILDGDYVRFSTDGETGGKGYGMVAGFNYTP